MEIFETQLHTSLTTALKKIQTSKMIFCITSLFYLSHVGGSQDGCDNQEVAENTAKDDQRIEKDQKIKDRLRDR